MSALPPLPTWAAPVLGVAATAAMAIPVGGPAVAAALQALAWLGGQATPTPLQEGVIDEINKLNDPNLQAAAVFNGMLSYITDPTQLNAQLVGGDKANAWALLNNALASQSGTVATWVTQLADLCDPTSASFTWPTALYALPVYALGAATQSLVLSQLLMLSPYMIEPPPALTATPYTGRLIEFSSNAAAQLDAAYAACRAARLAEITDVSQSSPEVGPYGPVGEYDFAFQDHATGKKFDTSLNPYDGSQVPATLQKVQTQRTTYYDQAAAQLDATYSPSATSATLRSRAAGWQAVV